MRRYPVIAAIAWVTVTAGSVLAHASLDHAEPKVGSAVESPAEVKIWFTDDADLRGTTIEVLDASGKQVDKKDLHGDPKAKSIVVVSLLPKLPAGKYKVIWHARCPQGHKTKGEFSFEVK